MARACVRAAGLADPRIKVDSHLAPSPSNGPSPSASPTVEPATQPPLTPIHSPRRRRPDDEPGDKAGSITGRVWHDADKDGAQDKGEEVVAGVPVFLVDAEITGELAAKRLRAV